VQVTRVPSWGRLVTDANAASVVQHSSTPNGPSTALAPPGIGSPEEVIYQPQRVEARLLSFLSDGAHIRPARWTQAWLLLMVDNQSDLQSRITVPSSLAGILHHVDADKQPLDASTRDRAAASPKQLGATANATTLVLWSRYRPMWPAGLLYASGRSFRNANRVTVVGRTISLQARAVDTDSS